MGESCQIDGAVRVGLPRQDIERAGLTPVGKFLCITGKHHYTITT